MRNRRQMRTLVAHAHPRLVSPRPPARGQSRPRRRRRHRRAGDPRVHLRAGRGIGMGTGRGFTLVAAPELVPARRESAGHRFLALHPRERGLARNAPGARPGMRRATGGLEPALRAGGDRARSEDQDGAARGGARDARATTAPCCTSLGRFTPRAAARSRYSPPFGEPANRSRIRSSRSPLRRRCAHPRAGPARTRSRVWSCFPSSIGPPASRIPGLREPMRRIGA